MDLMHRRSTVAIIALGCSLAAASVAASGPAIDYAAFYARGITFARFLDEARAQVTEWHANYDQAAVSPDLITRMRALPERRRLLVVAVDNCSDSVNTVPYLARLVDGAPERLEMRIIDSTEGRPVMEAHPNTAGKGSTPTVVILGEDGRFIASWSERPAELQKRALEDRKTLSRQQFHDRLMKWYADDKGRSAVAEIAALLEKR